MQEDNVLKTCILIGDIFLMAVLLNRFFNIEPVKFNNDKLNKED